MVDCYVVGVEAVVDGVIIVVIVVFVFGDV